MIANVYDEITKEFLYEVAVEKSPLEQDVILMPPNATLLPLNESKENYAQIFNGEEWEYIEDYRGQTVWKSYYESMVIEELGAIPDGYSLQQPEMTEEERKALIGQLKCTKRVFALMLQELGVDYLTVLLPLIESNPQAKLEWDLCIELERKNPLLDVMAGQLGITPDQLDGLFKYANGEITLDEFKALYVVTNEDLPTDENNASVQENTEL
jgi:hypothetical protein